MRRGIKAVLLVTGSALLVVGGGLYLASCKDTKLAEKVREVDERIMKAQNEYDARMRKAMATAKDFVISH